MIYIWWESSCLRIFKNMKLRNSQHFPITENKKIHSIWNGLVFNKNIYKSRIYRQGRLWELRNLLTSADFNFLYRITKATLLSSLTSTSFVSSGLSRNILRAQLTVYERHSTVSPLPDSPIDVTGRKQNIAFSLTYELFLEVSKIFPSRLDCFGLKGFSNVLPTFLQPSHNLLN